MNCNINIINGNELRFAFRDTSSRFDELLTKTGSVTVHQINLQLLETEIYKTKNDLNPKFMNEIFFEKKHSYELRGNDILSVPIAYTNGNGRETIRYTGYELLNALPVEIEDPRTLIEFKR